MGLRGQNHTPATLTLRETVPTAHQIREWVGPTASQHTLEKNVSCSSWELNHDSSVMDILLIMKTHPQFSEDRNIFIVSFVYVFILFSYIYSTLNCPHIKNLPASRQISWIRGLVSFTGTANMYTASGKHVLNLYNSRVMSRSWIFVEM
jgi:hypothetical protein